MNNKKILTAGWLFLFLAIFALQSEIVMAEDSNTVISTIQDHKVNINTASALEIATIPGLGVRKSEAIVQYRKVHGPFKTIDELKNVSGIGEKLLKRIRAYVEIGHNP